MCIVLSALPFVHTCIFFSADEDPAKQVALTAEQLASVAAPSGSQPPYLHTAGSGEEVKAATHWVAADLASQVGVLLELLCI